MPKNTPEPRKPQIGTIEERYGGASYRAIWRAAGKQQKKTFDTYDEACDHLDEMAIEVRRGGSTHDLQKTRVPFRVVAENWFKHRPQGRQYQASRGKERSCLNARLIPYFGDMTISEITRQDIQAWINEVTEDPSLDCQACEELVYAEQDDEARCDEHRKVKPLAAASVREYYGILGQIMREAHLDGLLGRNALCPVGKGLHMLPSIEGRMIWLSDEEVDHLLKVTREKFPKHYPAIHLEAHTGLRQGELLGLHRSCFNPIGGFLMVTQAVKRGKGNGAPVIGRTKTNRPRRIELMPCCVDVLNQQLAAHSYDVIFCGHGGKPQNTTNWRRRVWYPIRDAAGFGETGLHFHDLRHTHCSQLLAAGWEPTVVSERMGHKSTKMTLDRYGHAMAGRQKKLLTERGIRAV